MHKWKSPPKRALLNWVRRRDISGLLFIFPLRKGRAISPCTGWNNTERYSAHRHCALSLPTTLANVRSGMQSCGGVVIALYSWGCVRWLSKEGNSVCPARTAPQELSYVFRLIAMRIRYGSFPRPPELYLSHFRVARYACHSICVARFVLVSSDNLHFH